MLPRSSAVAVGTTDLALGDFFDDALAGNCRARHHANITGLMPTNVVELEQVEVGFTAVDARVDEKVLADQLAVASTLAIIISPSALRVDRPIAPVVLPPDPFLAAALLHVNRIRGGCAYCMALIN